MQAAGQIPPSLPSTLLGLPHLQGLLLRPHSPPARLHRPPPLPLSPAATQVLGEGYRVGATAPSAFWRPLLVRLRITTMLTETAGQEQWRTSIHSTEVLRAGFSGGW